MLLNKRGRPSKKDREYIRKRRMMYKIFNYLDMPGPIHKRWRKLTHDPVKAYLIGMFLGGSEGGKIALQHVIEDEVFLSFRKLGIPEEAAERLTFMVMYGGRKGKGDR